MVQPFDEGAEPGMGIRRHLPHDRIHRTAEIKDLQQFVDSRRRWAE